MNEGPRALLKLLDPGSSTRRYCMCTKLLWLICLCTLSNMLGVHLCEMWTWNGTSIKMTFKCMSVDCYVRRQISTVWDDFWMKSTLLVIVQVSCICQCACQTHLSTEPRGRNSISADWVSAAWNRCKKSACSAYTTKPRGPYFGWATNLNRTLDTLLFFNVLIPLNHVVQCAYH